MEAQGVDVVVLCGENNVTYATEHAAPSHEPACGGATRTVAIITFGATVVAFAFAAAAPQVALVIVGIWFVVIVAIGVMLGLAERTSR